MLLIRFSAQNVLDIDIFNLQFIFHVIIFQLLIICI